MAGEPQAALSAAPQHISAYALIVEEGTGWPLGSGGASPPTDEDDLADKYLIADDRFTAAGHTAYEVSNWTRSAATRCRTIWAIGATIIGGASAQERTAMWVGAGGTSSIRRRTRPGLLQAYHRQAQELLSAEQRRIERILLELRLDSLDLTAHHDGEGSYWAPCRTATRSGREWHVDLDPWEAARGWCDP